MLQLPLVQQNVEFLRKSKVNGLPRSCTMQCARLVHLLEGGEMIQTIIKDGKVYCVTSVPYPPEVIRQMKKAGYKVKEE